MPQGSDERFVLLVKKVLDAGLADRLLLGGDMLGYDASLPDGGEIEPYAYLPQTFLPKLATEVGAESVRRLTHTNPFDAFAR